MTTIPGLLLFLARSIGVLPIDAWFAMSEPDHLLCS